MLRFLPVCATNLTGSPYPVVFWLPIGFNLSATYGAFYLFMVINILM